jgi:8-oxo-dGTP pyrophosphatase MutT (NUDIX family)
MDNLESRLSGILNQDNFSVPVVDSPESTAAVLILLVQEQQEWKIVYTRRTNNVKTHQGEVSFPGGSFESEDESIVQTALRETFEEIGVKEDCIKILGRMEAIRTISNFMVHPVVGILTCIPEFKINPDEVERVFMIPLHWLENPENYFEQDHLVENRFVRKVIHYRNFEGEHLWGLTARITQQLLEIK